MEKSYIAEETKNSNGIQRFDIQLPINFQMRAFLTNKVSLFSLNVSEKHAE
jgi:hypothetical protein